MKNYIKNLKIVLFLSLFTQIGLAQSITIEPNKETVKGKIQLNGRLFINSNTEFPLPTNSYLKYGNILSISNDSDSSDLDLVIFEDSGFSPWLNLAKARGTKTTPATVQSNDDLFQIHGFAYNNDDFYDAGGIRLFVDGTPTTGKTPTALQFDIQKQNQTSPQTTMVIRSSGKVGIGIYNPEEQLSLINGMNIDQNNENSGTINKGLKFGSNSGEGIASRRTGGDDSNFHGLDFYTNFNSRMTITNYGLVGIGTTNPTQARLVVNGNVNGTVGNFSYLQLNSPLTGSNTTGNSYNYSIYATNRIAASEFNAFSDARIKDIKGVSNNAKDLETLSKIEITDYEFKDKIGKGNGQYKKVIAQQVESVYPQAVSKLTDCIPDIYQLAKIENDFISLPNHNLKIGEKVKLIFNATQELVEVKEVNEKGFKIVNPKSSIVNQQVFVYGREVSDFRSIDYEALSMLNISATQALLQRLNEAEGRINKLEKIQTEILQQIGQLSALNK